METKKNSIKPVLITCGIILLVACLCVVLIIVGALAVNAISGRQVIPADWMPEAILPDALFETTEIPATEAVVIETEAAPTATETPQFVALDPQLAAAMDKIQAEVIELRGLSPVYDVPRALMNAEELADKVENDFFSDYTPEDAALDVKALAVIGLLPRGYDLHQLYLDLYSDQVAGYYDDDVKAMYVISEGKFGGLEKMTHAHEYTHVLQDQVYDFQNGLLYNDETCEADSEYCAAVQCLIEGDATLSELLWFYSFTTEEEQQEVFDFYETYSSDVYDNAPEYLQADFGFPYDAGYTFVEYYYKEDGFDGVDALYANPPVSTEQILHPENYPNDVPLPVTLPDLTDVLGGGWYENTRNVMGEWYTYLIFAKGADAAWQMNDDLAKDAAEGWGGDAYLVYLNDDRDDAVFVMASTWDTPEDAAEYADVLKSYHQMRWGTLTNAPADWVGYQDGVEYSMMYFDGDSTVYWVVAPDAATAAAIAQGLMP